MNSDLRLQIAVEAARLEGYRALQEERDRRYAEVAAEREKTLKMKEDADQAALQLSRDAQTYKDEKANELRSQIESERGIYMTRSEYIVQHQALVDRLDLAVKVVADQVDLLGQRVDTSSGAASGVLVARQQFFATMAICVALGGLVAAVLFHFIA